MKKTVAFIILCLLNYSVFPQGFYKTFPSGLDLNTNKITDVVEINNSYYKCENEYNQNNNFRLSIRIIKTDASGNTIWIKRYDTHQDTSISVTEMIKSHDNQLLLSCDHNYNNSVSINSAGLIKIDTNGNFVWSKRYSKTWGYKSKLLLLPDSNYIYAVSDTLSNGLRLLKLNKNGNIIHSKKIQTPASWYSYNGLSVNGGSTYISLNKGNLITADTALSVLHQKNYDVAPVKPYFKHFRTTNNENVFVSARINGGFLSGEFRIFRVKDNGTVMWAKNVIAWKVTSNQSPINRFDYIDCQSVYEDPSGNIIVNMLEEDENNMIYTFEANGGLLKYRFCNANSLKHCSDGDVLIADNLQSKKLFSKFNLDYTLSCDSLTTVNVNDGIDSLSINQPTFTIINAQSQATGFSINVVNTISADSDFCQFLANGIKPNYKNVFKGSILCPNPANESVQINPAIETISEISIINSLGHVTSVKSNGHTINLSGFSDGIYFVSIKSKGEIYTTKLIKSN